MSRIVISTLLMLSVILLIPGCLQQPTRVSHQMLANKDKIPSGFSKKKSFIIAGGEYQISGSKQKDGLQNRELEKKLRLALEKEGYIIKLREVADTSIDYAIAYKYRISSKKQTAYEPRCVSGSIWTSKDNAFLNTTTYVPVERTYFTKMLELFVVELPEYLKTRKLSAPIWQSEAWTVDESDDLRKNLDFLIVQSTGMFGKDSAGTINTDMYDDNKSVVSLRSAYANPIEK
ncbi:hypothetical protein BH09DEP1_BH09DEP1_3250 [soil metagenome]